MAPLGCEIWFWGTRDTKAHKLSLRSNQSISFDTFDHENKRKDKRGLFLQSNHHPNEFHDLKAMPYNEP